MDKFVKILQQRIKTAYEVFEESYLEIRRELKEEEISNSLLESANEKQMQQLPVFKQKKIANAASDLTRAMPMDACDFGKFVYKSADSITDPADREIVILNLLGAAQQ